MCACSLATGCFSIQIRVDGASVWRRQGRMSCKHLPRQCECFPVHRAESSQPRGRSHPSHMIPRVLRPVGSPPLAPGQKCCELQASILLQFIFPRFNSELHCSPIVLWAMSYSYPQQRDTVSALVKSQPISPAVTWYTASSAGSVLPVTLVLLVGCGETEQVPHSMNSTTAIAPIG